MKNKHLIMEKNLNNPKSHQQLLSRLAPERWRLQIPDQKQNNYKIKQKSKMGGQRQKN